jgi:Fic-DOC domain mobile mystery protein B
MMDPLFDGPGAGTPIEPEAAEGLLLPHVQTREQLNELENANILEGQNWLSRKKAPKLFSEGFARTLHKRLFGHVWAWAGTFRDRVTSVGAPPSAIQSELEILLDDTRLCQEHRVYRPLEIAARFHRRLVSIHPFVDGNGRHARIMTDALLTKVFRQPAIPWGGDASTDPKQRRAEYLHALREADQGDYQRLLRFVGVP